ncbi:tyrosine-type recombinase/integrase [uncultured Parasphingorhabdus sp.]|uniref:tyrosine-type recombinase/integrase n=1 Tax=uncultured Parasphingorhabdus sp. TaxID=2709694 RepID=UPI0030D70BC4|tara:strand:+ start:28772 stop:30067 length:1296 start_codon:yes stop_codon:yes gene_type:complete
MAVGKITKTTVDAVTVPEAGKRAYLWDDTLKGFGLMVTDKGKRSYIIQYRIGGRGKPSRRVTIGGHGNPWTAKTARDYAAELLEQVRRKVDPFEARKAVQEQERQNKAALDVIAAQHDKLAFSVIADAYIEAAKAGTLPGKKGRVLKSWANIKGVIDKDLSPAFGSKPLPSISADDINELIERVGGRSPSSGRHAYSAVSAVFAFATKQQRRIFPPSASPMADVSPPAPAGERDHYLNDNELRVLWLATDDLGWPFGEVYKLLILTGQRLREVAEAPWTEFDLDKRQWLVSGNRSKNDRPNLVQLSDTALEIVTALPRLASDGQFLFTTTGDSPVSGFSRAKARIDVLVEKRAKSEGFKFRPWRVHDLRRTMARGCQELGFKLEVIEEVINHKSGSRAGIVGTYQVYEFQPEKRAAWQAWEEKVLSISGRN